MRKFSRWSIIINNAFTCSNDLIHPTSRTARTLADLINPKKAGMKGKKAAGNRNAKQLKEPKEEPTKYEVGACGLAMMKLVEMI